MPGACISLTTFNWLISNKSRYGKEDEMGFLNRLTDENVVTAAKEIKTGRRYSHHLSPFERTNQMAA
jgi:hypothetical protein